LQKLADRAGGGWRLDFGLVVQNGYFFYRDAFLQSDIELIDRRMKSGYVERNGDLIRLTALGRQDLEASEDAPQCQRSPSC
jgi:hypothetical protein